MAGGRRPAVFFSSGGRRCQVPERENFLTPEGLTKLEEELEYLRTVRRQGVAEKIQQAKELRSAVNSPEYEDAKNEQGFVEGRILALEKIIKNAIIIQLSSF